MQKMEKGKRYWRWQVPEEARGKMKVQGKQGLRQLINRLIVIGMLLSFIMFFVLPLALYPNLTWWMNSGNMLSLAVSLILLFVVYSINSGKYEFRPPIEVEDLKRKPRSPLPPPQAPIQRQRPIMQEPRRPVAPRQIRLGFCDICDMEVPLTQLSGFEFEENGNKVTINICKKCYREAGYEQN